MLIDIYFNVFYTKYIGIPYIIVLELYMKIKVAIATIWEGADYYDICFRTALITS